MNKSKKRGKFIAIEGPDGSGKATQAKLLIKAVKDRGHKVKEIDFPQYGNKSAGLVEEYLNGKYGKAKEVGPYRASIFYACDRYDASFKMRKWIKEGYIIIADRYIASNIAHQGGKIRNKKQRRNYLRWLYHLEYNIFEIPKPDITLILKTSPELSHRLSSEIKEEGKKKKKALYLKRGKRDIHEKDKKHLRDSLNAYLDLTKEYPREFKTIECIGNGKLLSPEDIHQKIKKVLKFK